MSFIDVFILICVLLIVGLILFFNIRSMVKGETKCTKCPYASKCNNINKQSANNKTSCCCCEKNKSENKENEEIKEKQQKESK